MQCSAARDRHVDSRHPLLRAQRCRRRCTSSAAMRRLLDVIERRQAMAAADGGATLAGVRGELALQGVVFAYPARPEHPVLKRRVPCRAWLR